MKEQKEKLRKSFLAKRINFESNLLNEYAIQAQNHLLESEIWQKSTQICLYMPIKAEMSTHILLKDAWERNIMVLLPKCHKIDKGCMDFVPCLGYNDLHAGKYNILEPRDNLKALPLDSDILLPSLVIVPALAYDAQGYRLGYGGGYYDRILKHSCFSQAKKIGLCFNFQIINLLPAESWDQKVDALCSEDGLKWI